MNHETAAVLDTSALLALIYDEAGARRVEVAIRRGSIMSAVNWAEALSRMADLGDAVEVSAPRVRALIEKNGTLDVLGLDTGLAEYAARLRTPTRHLGLSLADRTCLALGKIHRLPVLTTDRAWRSLHISVKIEVIR